MSKDMSTHHRRDFVRALAIAAPVALIATPAEAADEPKKKEEPKKKAEPEKAAPPSEVDARMALVIARYGPALDDEARKAVRAEVVTMTRRAEALRKFPLENGDGPFPVFQPYRAPLS